MSTLEEKQRAWIHELLRISCYDRSCEYENLVRVTMTMMSKIPKEQRPPLSQLVAEMEEVLEHMRDALNTFKQDTMYLIPGSWSIYPQNLF